MLDRIKLGVGYAIWAARMAFWTPIFVVRLVRILGLKNTIKLIEIWRKDGKI